MKGAIVKEIRLSVVKGKKSCRLWQSCDPNSVTSLSFASSLNMTALPVFGPQRGSAGTFVCQTDPPNDHAVPLLSLWQVWPLTYKWPKCKHLSLKLLHRHYALQASEFVIRYQTLFANL